MLRKIYRTFVHWPWLDGIIYKILDYLTDSFARFQQFSFPKNYIRRWKLNMLFGQYEPETFRLFKKILTPGMTIVDVGAHIGYFTRLFGKMAGRTGRVFAFEADPENYGLLVKNTCRIKNIRPVKLALSDKKGKIDFYHCEEKSGSHSILQNVPLDFRKRKIMVASCDLDSWLKQENVARVDAIKMDIEGGESAALRGMERTLSSADNLILVIEFAPAWIKAAGFSPNQFLQKIASFDFEIFCITEKGPVKLRSVLDENFMEFLPKSKDGKCCAGEFINLCCVKNNR